MQLLNNDNLHKGIDVGEIFLREGFIYDGDGETTRYVLIREGARLDNRYPEGAEICRSDHREPGAGARGGISGRLPRNAESHAPIRADNGRACRSRGGSDSRKGGNPLKHLAIECRYLLKLRKAFNGYGQRKSEEMILSKAEVRARQFPEAVDHESRASEQC